MGTSDVRPEASPASRAPGAVNAEAGSAAAESSVPRRPASGRGAGPAERTRRSARLLLGITAVAFLLGAVTALVYHLQDLTLSHYDARAHLVVARRIIDSLTPGWRQIGAVWLPLPHLLNALPVQIDAWYRTGASAVAMSVVSYAVAVAAVSWLILQATGSGSGAVAGAAVLGLNPNVLYLQATPMTEPMLLGLSMLALALLYRWIEAGATSVPHAAGLALAAACLTRYEAWAIAVAAVGLSGFVVWRQGCRPDDLRRAIARLAVYPIAAILAFLVLSRLTVGMWLVTGGFFVPSNPAHGRPDLALAQIVESLGMLTGMVMWMAVIAAPAVVASAVLFRGRSTRLVLIAALAAAALPLYAFSQGHPVRVRYMVPLIPAVALFVGSGVGLLRAGRPLAAMLVVIVALVQAPPFDRGAPMLREAQRDMTAVQERERLTQYLAEHYDGEKILCSMGSLAPFMQEAAHGGFALWDFLHEGNGFLWPAALARPREHAGWILIRAGDREGRDALLKAMEENPRFFVGFSEIGEFGGVTLYRRGER
jgi:hypothetical protein